MANQTKKPMLKETVGAIYYSFNTPAVNGDFNPATYSDVIKTEVVKNIGTTENTESATVKSSGKDYITVSQSNNIEQAVEVIAFPADDLAKMRGDIVDTEGLISTGRSVERPYFAFGKVVKKLGGGLTLSWYPKCQLIENTDDIATKEESFSEQNDTVTIRCYAFNNLGDIRNYVDTEAGNFPEGLTEEKFFDKVVVTKQNLADAIVEGT